MKVTLFTIIFTTIISLSVSVYALHASNVKLIKQNEKLEQTVFTLKLDKNVDKNGKYSDALVQDIMDDMTKKLDKSKSATAADSRSAEKRFDDLSTEIDEYNASKK